MIFYKMYKKSPYVGQAEPRSLRSSALSITHFSISELDFRSSICGQVYRFDDRYIFVTAMVFYVSFHYFVHMPKIKALENF